jgi:MFS family permease
MMDGKDTGRPKREKRFFSGYIVVMAAFFIMFVSWAAYNSFGVFLTPLLENFNWNTATTSGAFSLSMFLYGILGIVVGGLNDRLGPRLVLTLCGVLLGLGYLLMSQVGALWQLYLFLGVIIGVAMSGVWVPQVSTVARWFVRRRTLMTGLVIAGSGIGQLVGPVVISRLIANVGWARTYMMAGIAVLVLIVLAAQLLRREPAQTGRLPGENGGEKALVAEPVNADFSFEKAVKTSQFWILFGMFACYGYGVFSIVVHIVPYAISLNISPVRAADILATRGAMGILGSYVLSLFADRTGNKQIYVFGFVFMIAALFGLSLAKEEWMLYLFVVAFGFAIGGMAASESPITAWLFGLGSHGLIYGVVHVGFTVGAAAGPYLTGYLHDLMGSYGLAFLIASALAVIGLFLTLMLKPVKSRALDPPAINGIVK